MKTKNYSSKGVLKSTRNVALTLFLCSLGLNSMAQESYYLSSTITVGCSGANALMDMTKKAEIAIMDNEAIMEISSTACKKSYKMASLPDFKEDGVEKAFFSSKEKRGLLKLSNGELLLFNKDGSFYKVMLGAHTDKKVAKDMDVNAANDKYKTALNSIEAKAKEAEEKGKAAEKQTKADQAAANAVASLGDFYQKHKGQILFTTKHTRGQLNKADATKDQESDFVTEFELGDNSMYARAFFTAENSGAKSINIKYSIGDVSVSSEQLRAEHGVERGDRYSGGVAGANYFSNTFIGHFPMVSANEQYYGPTYSMAEDAFRVLLSKVKDKLTPGSTHTVKVEIAYMNDLRDVNQPTFISGTVKMKITAKSNSILSLLCRCQTAGKTDATTEKQIETLLLSDPNISKVHKVWILSRDYKIETSFGVPVNRNMEGQAFVTTKDGVIMVWKGTVKWAYDGSSYSTIAQWHKGRLFMPVSPTCLKGI